MDDNKEFTEELLESLKKIENRKKERFQKRVNDVADENNVDVEVIENILKFYNACKAEREYYMNKVAQKNPDLKPVLKSMNRRISLAKTAKAVTGVITLPFRLASGVVALAEGVAVAVPLVLTVVSAVGLSECSSKLMKIIFGTTGIVSATALAGIGIPLELAQSIIKLPETLRQAVFTNILFKSIEKDINVMKLISNEIETGFEQKNEDDITDKKRDIIDTENDVE